MNNLAIIKEANDKIFHLNERNNVENEGIIFVYTPPKVGSTTLVSSLRISVLKFFSILHIHDETMLKVLTGIDNVKITDLINYNASIGKKVYVIDIFRTPIERKMSEYFEKLSTYHFNNSIENLKKYSLELIELRFDNIFCHLGLEDHYFEKFGITPPESFDFKNKYIHQEINNINYIKLRLNDVNEWGNILTKILGKKVYIVPDYKTEDKEIGDLYRRFKEYYKIPVNYLEDIEKSKSIKYYMSLEECIEYKKEWMSKKKEVKRGYDEKEYKLYSKISNENSVNEKVCKSEMHYVDEGCKCEKCNKKREDVKKRIVEGKSIKSVIHEKAKMNEKMHEKMHEKMKLIRKEKMRMIIM